MEAYKHTLKIRMTLLAGLVTACCGLLAYSMNEAAVQNLPDFLRGFQTGAASGMGIAALVWLIKYGQVLRDPKRLQLQYIKETDERLKAINARAGMPLIWITSVVLILAGMVGGYWHPMIFYSLIPAGALQLVASRAVALVYGKII